MTLLWLGILCILLDLRIILLTISLNIFPDFVGFILLYLGLKKLTVFSPHFQKGKTVAFVVIFIAILLEIISFFTIELPLVMTMFVRIARDGILFYLLYQIIKGIMDIEKEEKQNYKTQIIYRCGKYGSLSM